LFWLSFRSFIPWVTWPCCLWACGGTDHHGAGGVCVRGNEYLITTGKQRGGDGGVHSRAHPQWSPFLLLGPTS
jgi:hypothetical protein